MNSPDPDPPKNAWASIARYSEIGFIIPAAVLLGFFLGKLLDYWLRTYLALPGGPHLRSRRGVCADDSHGGNLVQGQVMTAGAGLEVPQDQARNEEFFAGAISRILNSRSSLPPCFFSPSAGASASRPRSAFAAGAAVSWVNFQSLRRGVEGLAERVAGDRTTQRGASSFSALSFAICWLPLAPMLYSRVRAKPLRVSCLAFVCPWQRCWSRQPTKPTWSSAADTRAQRNPVLIEIAWSNLHSRSS